MTPLEFIQLINKTFPEGYPEMSGGCYKFHLLLREVFTLPKYFVTLQYDRVAGHIYTEINMVQGGYIVGSMLYDIYGQYTAQSVKYLNLESLESCGGYNYFNKLFAEYL